MKLDKGKIINSWPFVIAILGILAISKIENQYYLGMIFNTLLWVAIAGSWQIVGGYAGEFSLGHAAFFGIGAYTSTLLYIHFSVSPWIGMFIGAAFAGIIGFLLSWTCFRLRGHFFTLATLAFGQVVLIIATSWRSLTSGSEGLLLPIKMGFWQMSFESKHAYVYLVLIYAISVILFTYVMERRRLGYYLIAYRENDEAARSLGVNTFRARLTASTISAFFTAIGGTIYAQYTFFIEPESVLPVTLSIQAPLVSIVGGLGTPFGPLFGAVLILPLSQFLRGIFGSSFNGLHLIIYGLILIVVLLLMPSGLGPVILKGWRKITGAQVKKINASG